MPLLGKIVVIKRNGTDGTEFPLTASCLFGRKLDCDIRIQLPQVSKEHCRIELNENKELILTNLSSVNPTRINGEVLQQPERLKQGDLITIIDRSFRFEYPPAPTPKKKRLSTPVKGDAVKVLQHQQVQSTPGTTERKKAEHSATCLKDGSNLPSMDQSIGDLQSKVNTNSTCSPFSDLYNMVKRDLATKPWKSATVPNTPVSKPPSQKEEPKKASACNDENDESGTTKLAKKRRSSNVNLTAASKTPSEVTDVVEKQKRRGSGTPISQTPQATTQKFTTQEVAQQIVFESLSTPKSPNNRRKSASQVLLATRENEVTPQNAAESTNSREAEEKQATRSSPRASAGKRFQVEDMVHEIISANDYDVKDNGRVASKKHKSDDLPLPAPKRKRVSFGGKLSPELFDKRLPPDSPLRRGATPGSFFQKPQSLLRRASAIGLMGFKLDEAVSEIHNNSASPKRVSSPAKVANVLKTPSPAKKSPKMAPTPKTPSPAKKSPKKAPTPSPAKKSPKTAPTSKTPSPAKKSPKVTPAPKSLTPVKKSPMTPSLKGSKTLPPSLHLATTQTPKSAKRVSSGPVITLSRSEGSLLETPTMHGRFSVSKISTPSPVSDQDRDLTVPVVEEPPKYVTPKNRLKRRSSMRASAKSALNSVVRSRRSGASLANLKVVSSWADVVKFGQVKPQMEVGVKKMVAKQKTKQPKVEKLKTPARRLKDATSTGHADSPATIVVGKAYLRAAQHVGAAPKVVCNVALLKKDMKMDEDLTGVADIFKTPATFKRQKRGESSGTPFSAEMSGMKTPEEPGEMVVSPLSVASAAKRGHFSVEAVSRLLQDDQDGSLLENYDSAEMGQFSSVGASMLETQSEDQMEKDESGPLGQTSKRKPKLAECLTGVKNLLRTPKRSASPVEDLRGKLVRTPKELKPLREESLEDVKELLKTPKQKGTPVEDLSGIKEMSPRVISSPVVCTVALKRLKTPKDKTKQNEDLTGVKELMKTPKQKSVPIEDLTGIKEMMKTPKLKLVPVEDLTGIKQMMKTPKQKREPVEDLSGIREMMKTPKQKTKPVEDLSGIKEMMKTPKLKSVPVEDLSGIKEMMKTPKLKLVPVEDLTGIKEMMKTPKQKSQPVEDNFDIGTLMKTPKPSAGVVLESIHLVEVVSEPTAEKDPQSEATSSPGTQDHLATSPEAMEVKMQDEENCCPVEDMKTDLPVDVETQSVSRIDVDEKPKTSSHDLKPAVIEDSVEEPIIAAVVASVPSSAPVRGRKGEAPELAQAVQSPARHSTRGRAAHVGVESPLKLPPAPARAERGRKATPHSENPCTIPAPGQTESAGIHESERNGAATVPTAVVETNAPVKSSMRSRRGKANKQDDKEPEIKSVDGVGPLCETEVAVKSSLKSRRGRLAKNVAQGNYTEAVCSKEESVPESDSEAPVKSSTKSKRGRPLKKAIQETESTTVNKEADGKNSETVAVEAAPEAMEAEAPVKSTTRTKRGKATKKEASDPTLVIGESKNSDAVVDLEAPGNKSSTRSKRGRAAKTETQKIEAADVKSDLKSSEAVVVLEAELEPETKAPIKSNTKSRRVRPTKIEAAIVNEPEIKSSEAIADVEPESSEMEGPVNSNMRSRRGRATKTEAPKNESDTKSVLNLIGATVSDNSTSAKSKRGKATKAEAAIVTEPEIESSEAVVIADAEPESSETEVPVNSNMRSRRGRATKPTKQEQAPANKESEKISDAVVEMPVVKPGRGRRAKQVEEPKSVVEPENKQEPPIARGAKSKTQVLEDQPQHNSAAPETEDPVPKPTVRGGRRTKQPKSQGSEDILEKVEDESKKEVDTKAARAKRAAVLGNEPETSVKRGRCVPVAEKPSSGRKASPEPELEETVSNAAAEGESESQPALGISDTSEAAVKKGKGRPAKKVKVLAKKTSSTDHEIEVTASKKVNWKPDLVTSTNIEDLIPEQKLNKEPSGKVSADPPSRDRRGRASRKQEPEKPKPSAEEAVPLLRRGRVGAAAVSEQRDVTSTKSGHKRKVVEVVPEQAQGAESSVKRRRGKAANEEEVPEAKAEPETDKPARGRRKGAKETSTALTQAEETDAHKKTEPDVSAPARRTRRR